MQKIFLPSVIFFISLLVIQSCKQKNSDPSKEMINQLQLKKGDVISCGTTAQQFGSLIFETSCNEAAKEDFNLGVELLHSFEYDEAEKVFARIIDKEPGCAMAYWGVAMANFHPLWTAPTTPELQKGVKAIQIAQTLSASGKEQLYIDAMAAFYDDWEKVDHRTRCLRFENAMEILYKKYPGDKEAAVLYALSLNAAADPNDKSFIKQQKAGSILQALYLTDKDHPGIAHYLIHTYDYPELAQQGLAAARQYASIAPSSAHALHMPSHIFTRLGLWDECIASNLGAISSAKCYAETAGIKGHWDEELHGMDYLVYAHLQKGENDAVKKQLDYLKTITHVEPENFKVAYAYAAMPARYVFENRLWQQAADLELWPKDFPWESFPWQEAIAHFTRLMGAVHTDNKKEAEEELSILNNLKSNLLDQKDSYKANQVDIQIKMAQAWISLQQKKKNEALTLMQLAADMEDKTGKHPVTPCEITPARELLGDMFLQLGQPSRALSAYEADLQKHPNRFNALYGAALASAKAGDHVKAANYYRQLINVANNKSARPEIVAGKKFLQENIVQ
ncbi:MAG TPA: tetratricopeptide repeat protein [Parafilimonas sp.]|nr:tetratricopeptide repeat protein [Parafilimonas sp.]